MNINAWLIGRRGQAIAVAIGLMGFLVIWFCIADPARSWFNDRSALLDQRQELLAHMRDLAATLPALRTASTDKHDEGTRAASILLPGDSDAAAAALQERVQKMAAEPAPASRRWKHCHPSPPPADGTRLPCAST
jgi:type II secretory pathway component PulM